MLIASLVRRSAAKLLNREKVTLIFCLVFSFLRRLGRLIFLLILSGALPAQPNDQQDEAEQSKQSFRGVQVQEKFHWNSNMGASVGELSLGQLIMRA